MQTVLLVIGTMYVVSGQLMCPHTSPNVILSIPQIDPCRATAVKTHPISIRTPNTQAYITDATLVYRERCTSIATYYFFGSQVCEHSCIKEKISDTLARDIASGFCDTETGHHIKFSSSYGGYPSCVYSWPTTNRRETLRCKRFSGNVIYTHLDIPHSTLGQMGNCNYTRGICELTDGSWMIWNVDERSKVDYIHKYYDVGICDGQRVWLPSDNIGFGLKVHGCEWNGYRKTYEGIDLMWEDTYDGNRRSKRSISENKTLSILEFLAGELSLQAGAFCQTMLGIVPASTIIPHANPTVYAQRLLNNTQVKALTRGSYLFIWYCQLVIAKPRNGTACYEHPRVMYHTGNWKEGFLTNDGEIIMESLDHGCNGHMLPYTLNGKAYLEIGQNTTELRVTPFDVKYHTSMPALNPNFSGIYHETPTWTHIIKSIGMTQGEILQGVRDMGLRINGQGGGPGSANVPGFKHGGFANFVAFIQFVSSLGFWIGGMWFVVSKCRPSPQPYLTPYH